MLQVPYIPHIFHHFPQFPAFLYPRISRRLIALSIDQFSPNFTADGTLRFRKREHRRNH